MKRMATAQVFLLMAALAVASCVAWAMQTGMRLVMDGRVISTNVRMFNASAYIKVSDMAKALDMTAFKQGNTYRLRRVGGSHPIRGAAGKMNANIFNGAWLLNVASARQVTAYSQRYGEYKERFTPRETGDILVVVTCRLKNGTNQTQDVSFDKDSSGNTALTDDQEHGYLPLAYDSRNSGYGSARMLPGSAHDFVVIFSVPEGAHLKDLIYTIVSSSEDYSKQNKSLDFRVSLKS